MKIRIEQHIPEAGYWPGQLIVDHPQEVQWLNERKAVPVPDEPETATLKPARQPRRGQSQ